MLFSFCFAFAFVFFFQRTFPSNFHSLQEIPFCLLTAKMSNTFFTSSAQKKLQLKNGFYSMEHFLSITLFREVHDSTERTTRCKKGQVRRLNRKQWRRFPVGKVTGKFSWKVNMVVRGSAQAWRVEVNWMVIFPLAFLLHFFFLRVNYYEYHVCIVGGKKHKKYFVWAIIIVCFWFYFFLFYFPGSADGFRAINDIGFKLNYIGFKRTIH